jgi:hypothetical protein
MKSGMHTHDPAPFLSLQIALAPHGEGLQGFSFSLYSICAETDLDSVSCKE